MLSEVYIIEIPPLTTLYMVFDTLIIDEIELINGLFIDQYPYQALLHKRYAKDHSNHEGDIDIDFIIKKYRLLVTVLEIKYDGTETTGFLLDKAGLDFLL